MKNLLKFALVLTLTLVVAPVVLTQPDSLIVVKPSGNPMLDQIMPYLISLVAPLIVGAVKKYLPTINIPTWIIPTVLLPLLGIGLAFLMNTVGGTSVAWWQGLLLGLLGIAVREIQDQLKQKVVKP